MFDFFNTSIFNKTMPSDHHCTDSNCSGSKLHGLNLTCYKCFRPYFFECLAKRPEIIEIVKLLEIDDTKNCLQTKVDKAINSLTKLFDTESVFEFICPSCKNDDLNNDIKQKYKSQIDELKKQITTEKSRATRAENKNKKLQQQLTDIQASNNLGLHSTKNDLTSNETIEKLHNKIENFKSVINDVKNTIYKKNQITPYLLI